MSHRLKVAIVGAGIAGLQIARNLEATCDVQVFEKSRGLGGRMSTRRADGYEFDHGAQYFTAHGAGFQQFLDRHLKSGNVAQWMPRMAALGATDEQPPFWNTPRYVAVPGMSSLCKAMAENLQIHRATRIAQITRADGQWRLTTETGGACGFFDWVISSAPVEQSAKLLPDEFAGHDDLQSARMQGCYSLMLGFENPKPLEWDAATVHGSPLAWIACNSSKPSRSGKLSILCQSRNDWAETHMEDDPAFVRDMLLSAFGKVTGMQETRAAYVSVHKWRFAKVETPTASPFLLDSANRLAAAGDWCGGGRVEAAFDSATALSVAIKEYISK